MTDTTDSYDALVASAGEPIGSWEGVLATEDEWTGDGRMFSAGALRWDPNSPAGMPLRWSVTDEGGHKGARHVGWITEAFRDPEHADDDIRGRGTYFDPEFGEYLQRAGKVGLSVDVDDETYNVTVPDEALDVPPSPGGTYPAISEKTTYTDGRIRGVTAVDIPAFITGYLEPVEALAASSEFAPRDGDGDGLINDATHPSPAPPKSPKPGSKKSSPGFGGADSRADPKAVTALRKKMEGLKANPEKTPRMSEYMDILEEQASRDPNADLIEDRGEFTDDPGDDRVFNFGANGECHWNTSKLFDSGDIDQIVIGYAYDPDAGWGQHTWGLKDGRIVETTRGNIQAEAYYGAPLTDSEARSFSAWTSANPPGGGVVRRA